MDVCGSLGRETTLLFLSRLPSSQNLLARMGPNSGVIRIWDQISVLISAFHGLASRNRLSDVCVSEWLHQIGAHNLPCLVSSPGKDYLQFRQREHPNFGRIARENIPKTHDRMCLRDPWAARLFPKSDHCVASHGKSHTLQFCDL